MAANAKGERAPRREGNITHVPSFPPDCPIIKPFDRPENIYLPTYCRVCQNRMTKSAPNVEPSEVVNHAKQSSRITFANDEFRLIIPLNYDEKLSRHRRETLKGDFSQKPRQKRSGKLRRRRRSRSLTLTRNFRINPERKRERSCMPQYFHAQAI